MKNFYIEELKDGRVRYRMSYKDPLTNKVKRVTANYEHDSVRNRRKAQEELENKINVLTAKVDYSNATLYQALHDYYGHMRITLKNSTATRNEESMRRLTALFPDETLIRNLTPQIMRDCLVKVSKNKPVTYNEYLKRFKTFWRWCYRNEYVADVSLADKLVSMPDETKRDRIADKFLEKTQATDLVNAMEGQTQYQLMTRFLILSGLRIGEAIALTWKDIDIDYIHVNKTLDYLINSVTTTKTFASERDVFIQKELATCIDDIREYNKWRESIGVKSDLVFPWKDGNFMHYDAYRKYLSETAKKVGIKQTITPHTLRHTHVSLMFAAGLPLDVVSRRVGHEDSDITKKIYLHMTEERKNAENNLLNQIKLL